MNMKSRPGSRASIAVAAMLFAFAGSAFAAEPPAAAAEPSKQSREQMAKMHEEMAACLRSDKRFAECQQQMHGRCMEAMGDQGCPMMGMGRGMGMQQRKREPPPSDKP